MSSFILMSYAIANFVLIIMVEYATLFTVIMVVIVEERKLLTLIYLMDCASIAETLALSSLTISFCHI